MILIAMSVFDSKAQAFMPPFFVAHVNVGVREFAHAANNAESKIGRNPEDYTLFEIGIFDDGTGEFVPKGQMKTYGLAASYVKPPESQTMADEWLEKAPRDTWRKPEGNGEDNVRS